MLMWMLMAVTDARDHDAAIVMPHQSILSDKEAQVTTRHLDINTLLVHMRHYNAKQRAGKLLDISLSIK